jgi:CRISPR-associated endonuclease Csn1
VERVLGLDIGITSCGWALIDHDKQIILDAGVRIFQKAENPENGKSLAEPRRKARGARKRLKSRKNRLKKLLKKLVEFGVIPASFKVTSNPDVWKLRVDALDRALTGQELTTVLFHIAKRRGFKSNKKKVSVDSEEKKEETDDGKMKSSAFKLKNSVEDSGKRSIGEYLAALPETLGSEQVGTAAYIKRRNGLGEYQFTVLRAQLQEEVRLLLEQQRTFGSIVLNTEEINEICDTMFSQKPHKSIEDKVGKCKFEPDKNRAPRNSRTFERSGLLQKLANLREKDLQTRMIVSIDNAQRNNLLETLETNGKVTYKDVAQALGFDKDYRFSRIDYSADFKKAEESSSTKKGDQAKTNAKEIFFKAGFCHEVRKELSIIPGAYNDLRKAPVLFDTIAEILSYYLDEDQREEKLLDLGLEQNVADALSNLKFSGFGELSFEVLRKIEPYLQEGKDYTQAMSLAGYDHSSPGGSGSEGKYLSPFNEVRNPVVLRALSEARKVVNAVIKKHGKPDRIVVELARDLGKTLKERNEIEKENKNREGDNNSYKTALEELGARVNGKNILKYRLWKDQSCSCAYSGEPISREHFIGENAVQIDHIIPFSRSCDDGFFNKVLVLTKHNQDKGDRTPFEWFGSNTEKWERFVLQHKNANRAKRNRLFQEVMDDEKKMIERNLNDTRYISRAFLQHIKQNLLPDLSKKTGEISARAQASSGRITAQLRKCWGLSSKERSTHFHHATDAILIACVTPKIVHNITNFFQKKTLLTKQDTLEKNFPLPWPTFRDDIKKRTEPSANHEDNKDIIFVSHRSTTKYTGQAHEETIISKRDNGAFKRCSISKLNEKSIEKLIDKDGRNKKLYTALKERLEEYHYDGQKAFNEPFYIPGKKKGTYGAQVKSVLLEEVSNSGIPVRGQGKKGKGFAANGSMIRVDLFVRTEKERDAFYMIPIYAHQVAQLPDQVVV